MSSPAVLPELVISIPPLVALIVIASCISSVDFKLIDDPVAVISISSPAVPIASISIPPVEALIVIASATFSLDNKLIEVVEVISISSPAVFPEDVMSIPPMVALIVIASGISSVDFKLIEEPVAVISISSPDVPIASIKKQNKIYINSRINMK